MSALTGREHSNQECVRTSTYLIYHCNEFVECMRADATSACCQNKSHGSEVIGAYTVTDSRES